MYRHRTHGLLTALVAVFATCFVLVAGNADARRFSTLEKKTREVLVHLGGINGHYNERDAHYGQFVAGLRSLAETTAGGKVRGHNQQHLAAAISAAVASFGKAGTEVEPGAVERAAQTLLKGILEVQGGWPAALRTVTRQHEALAKKHPVVAQLDALKSEQSTLSSQLNAAWRAVLIARPELREALGKDDAASRTLVKAERAKVRADNAAPLARKQALATEIASLERQVKRSVPGFRELLQLERLASVARPNLLEDSFLAAESAYLNLTVNGGLPR